MVLLQGLRLSWQYDVVTTLQLYTEGGNPIPKEEAKKLPDLDPTFVKAMAMQESNNGVTGQKDLLTANNPGDWRAGAKMKSAYGMSKDMTMNKNQSLYYGIRMVASKGFRSGIEYDNSTGNKTYTFKGWMQAAGNYNGQGVKGYQDYIQIMYNNSKKPEIQNY